MTKNDHNKNNRVKHGSKEVLRPAETNALIEINRLASDGSGVGYIDGKATFVPGMLPGEAGRVRIVEAKPSFQRAEIIEIITASPERTAPACSSYERCGGCDMQHMNYDYTLSWKKQWVEDALRRIGGFNGINVNDVIGMDNPWRYRNKAVLHKDQESGLGYYEGKSHKVVLFDDCLLLSDGMNRKIKRLQAALGGCNPDIRSVTFRESNHGKGLLLLEGPNAGQDDFASEIKKLKEMPEFAPQNFSIVYPKRGQEFAGSGPLYLNEYIDDMRFRVSPRAFLQVNSNQTKRLYSLILEWAALTGKEQVWDLYCGIGTITLMLAKRARKVIGIEENPFAVEDAIENAKDNKIANVDFIQGKVEERLKNLPETADLVVTDPPRAGMDPRVIERLLQSRPQKIIYVSCNPATMARDLKLLMGGNREGAESSDPSVRKSGYDIVAVQPVDMFPWSVHVECVTLMSRIKD